MNANVTFLLTQLLYLLVISILCKKNENDRNDAIRQVEYYYFFLMLAFTFSSPKLLTENGMVAALIFPGLLCYLTFTDFGVKSNPVQLFNDFLIEFILKKPMSKFTGKFGYQNKIYLVQLGMVDANKLIQDIHPSFKFIQSLDIKSDGMIDPSPYREEITAKIAEFIAKIQVKSNVKLSWQMISGSESDYHNVVLFVYSVQLIKADEFDEDLDEYDFESPFFSTIERLELEDDKFSRFPIGNLSVDKMKTIFSINKKGEVTPNPEVISFYHPLSTFELNSYELNEILQEISKETSQILSLANTEGEYFIGIDVFDQPVWVDKPENMLLLGNKSHLLRLIGLPFCTKSIVITDDDGLIEFLEGNMYSIRGKYAGKEIDISTLELPFLEYGIDNIHILSLILKLWELILPQDEQIQQSGLKVSSKIVDYIEERKLFEGKDFINEMKLHDLLKEVAYREFEEDISSEVIAKYNEIFQLESFNGEQSDLSIRLSEILDKDPGEVIIINLSSLTNKQKLAITIYFLVLKNQGIMPDQWLFFSFTHLTSGLELFLDSVSKYIFMNQACFHLQNLGGLNTWMKLSDFVFADKSINYSYAQNLFNFKPPPQVDGLMLNCFDMDQTIIKSFDRGY